MNNTLLRNKRPILLYCYICVFCIIIGFCCIFFIHFFPYSGIGIFSQEVFSSHASSLVTPSSSETFDGYAITNAEKVCAIKSLGEKRVQELLTGSSVTGTDIQKAKHCFGF